MTLPYSLEVLSEKITDCTSCDLRKVDCPVPGLGTKSDLMLLFEYPSKDEVLLGRPLEERSGLILKKIMKEVDFDYNKCYSTFALKCNTYSAEKSQLQLSVCKKWLWEEIKSVDPKCIVAFGKIPSKLLLKGNYSFTIKDIVGTFQNPDHLNGIKVVPWYSISMFNNMNSLIFKTKKMLMEIKKHYNV